MAIITSTRRPVRKPPLVMFYFLEDGSCCLRAVRERWRISIRSKLFLFLDQEFPPHSLSCSLDNERLILPGGTSHVINQMRKLLVIPSPPALSSPTNSFSWQESQPTGPIAGKGSFSLLFTQTNSGTCWSVPMSPDDRRPSHTFVFELYLYFAHLCAVCRLILGLLLPVRLRQLAGPEKSYLRF